jgi:hypothetical protein
MVLTVFGVPVLMGAFLLLMERFEARLLGVAPRGTSMTNCSVRTAITLPRSAPLSAERVCPSYRSIEDIVASVQGRLGQSARSSDGDRGWRLSLTFNLRSPRRPAWTCPRPSGVIVGAS